MCFDVRHAALVLLTMLLLAVSCGTSRKAERLRVSGSRASMSLPQDAEEEPSEDVPDTILVTDDRTGEELIIMKAVRDEEGEMVAHDEIRPAYVSARFRNVAERGGEVFLRFCITVPSEMMDSKWQLRFTPRMVVLGDTLGLENVTITGKDYRKAQLRGYQQYQKWLSMIVSDTTVFINSWQLEIFLERNLPQVYAFRNDSTFVSDEEFDSVFGVTEMEAINHYTDKLRLRYNRWLFGRKDKTFRKYVKVPIETEGLRLDTVIVSDAGDFSYEYVQRLKMRPRLKRADILLEGSIYEQDRKVYSVPQSDPLTFYISSISAFVDPTERYLTKVVERRVTANTACYIAFGSGSAEIEESLGSNEEEIGRIKDNLRDLMMDTRFDLDSIVVTSSASPEGAIGYNERLSRRRSQSISDYFGSWMETVRDSIDRVSGYAVDEYGRMVKESRASVVPFISRCGGENWRMLERLVEDDENVSNEEKEQFRQLGSLADLDERERRMQKSMRSYRYLRESLYPRLRTVRFDFHLHRKGVTKDTVHTTVLDSVYMNGVQAINDHDYSLAITLLRPYGDYNAAVAFCAMGYDASAMDILKNCPENERTLYMMAILHSRHGNDAEAVRCYLKSCELNPSYRHRGNLDPEISKLKDRYLLN